MAGNTLRLKSSMQLPSHTSSNEGLKMHGRTLNVGKHGTRNITQTYQTAIPLARKFTFENSKPSNEKHFDRNATQVDALETDSQRRLMKPACRPN